MPYPHNVIDGLDGARRYAFARMYAAEEDARQFERLCEVLRDRVDVILYEHLELLDAVLTARNTDAFARALRTKQVIDKFLRGRPEVA
jgi:hypothetical protein